VIADEAEERACTEMTRVLAQLQARDTERPKLRERLLPLIDRLERRVREVRGGKLGAKVGIEASVARWYLIRAIDLELDGTLKVTNSASRYLDDPGSFTEADIERLIDEARLAFAEREVEMEQEADEEATIGGVVAAARISVDEVTRSEPTPYLAPGLWHLTEASLLVGPSGVAKTTLLLLAFLQAAAGMPIWGRYEVGRAISVAIITNEDRRQQMLYRLREMAAANSIPLDAVERIFIFDFSEDMGAVLTETDPKTRGRKETAFAGRLEQLIRRSGAELVMIDPLVAILGGEENSNEHVGFAMKLLRSIANTTRSALVLIHHVAKAVVRGGTVDQLAGRGAAAFDNNTRWNGQVTRLREGRDVTVDGQQFALPTAVSDHDVAAGRVTILYNHKQSHGVPEAPLAFVRNGWRFDVYALVEGSSRGSAADQIDAATRAVGEWFAARASSGNPITATAAKRRRNEFAPPRRFTEDEAVAAIDRLTEIGALLWIDRYVGPSGGAPAKAVVGVDISRLPEAAPRPASGDDDDQLF